MNINETLRYFDQSEMENYLHEDLQRNHSFEKLQNKPVRGFALAMIFSGLVAGSIGILNYLDKSRVKDIPLPEIQHQME